MAEASSTPQLSAEPRASLGTANSRRLRQSGSIPACLYGLGQDTVSLTVSEEALKPVVLAGAQVVDVDISGTIEMAMIREVQWDTYMMNILHIDLQRIDREARIDLEVKIEARGDVNEGVLDHQLHSLTLSCPAYAVPDIFSIRVGSLKIGDEVTVSNLDLPEGTETEVPGDTVILRVNEVVDVDIVQEDVSAAAEPEVIGAKSDDEGDD